MFGRYFYFLYRVGWCMKFYKVKIQILNLDLKESIKVVPEILTYEIGISPLMNLVFYISLIIAFLSGLSFGFVIGILVLIVLTLLTTSLSVYINITYYTILYLTLIEKKKIRGLKIL